MENHFLCHLETDSNVKTLAEIDGDDSILYRIDLTTEMAFYLPQQFSSQWFLFSTFVSMYISSSGESWFRNAHINRLVRRISR